jgi:hypothetical protein
MRTNTSATCSSSTLEDNSSTVKGGPGLYDIASALQPLR